MKVNQILITRTKTFGGGDDRITLTDLLKEARHKKLKYVLKYNQSSISVTELLNALNYSGEFSVTLAQTTEDDYQEVMHLFNVSIIKTASGDFSKMSNRGE